MKKTFLLATVMIVFSSYYALAEIKPVSATLTSEQTLIPIDDLYCRKDAGDSDVRVPARRISPDDIVPPSNSNIYIISKHKCASSGGLTEFYKIAFAGSKFYVRSDSFDSSVSDSIVNGLDHDYEELLKHEEFCINKSREEWKKTVAASVSRVKALKEKGVAILYSNVYDMGEYVKSTGFRVAYFNPTNKTIKYVTAIVSGYNSVGDAVGKLNTWGAKQLKFESIGPIEPGANSVYAYDSSWFTDVVESSKILSLTVKYMDGSVKKIAKPDSARVSSRDFNVIKIDYQINK